MGVNDIAIVAQDNEFQLKQQLMGSDQLFIQFDFSTNFNDKSYEILINSAKFAKIKFIIFFSFFSFGDQSKIGVRQSTIENYILKSKIPFCSVKTGFTYQQILKFNPNLFNNGTLSFVCSESTPISFIDELDVIQSITKIIQQPENHQNQGAWPNFFLNQTHIYTKISSNFPCKFIAKNIFQPFFFFLKSLFSEQ